jgi:hypothetical protein
MADQNEPPVEYPSSSTQDDNQTPTDQQGLRRDEDLSQKLGRTEAQRIRQEELKNEISAPAPK